MYQHQSQLEEISRKIEDFQSHFDESQKELLNEINIVDIKKYKTDINAAINEFGRIYSYATAYSVANDMRNFLSKHSEDIDFKILDRLEQSDSLSKSAIYLYANLGKTRSNKHKNDLKLSANSLVYEFQISVLYFAMKYVAILEWATKIQNHYEGVTFNQQVWNYRRSQLNKKYEALIERKSSNYVNDPKSLSSFINLSTDLQGNETKFKKVFQTYWKNEWDITKYESCSLNCDVGIRDFSDNYCNGKIGQCFYNNDFGTQVTYGPQLTAAVAKGTRNAEDYYISIDPLRIYSRYTVAGRSHGIWDASYLTKYTLQPFSYAFRECDICQCTCDQSNAEKSARKMYSGIMKAPDGFVITGVRFAMSTDIIFIDIQYGKLVSEGLVDPSSLKWNGPPPQLTSNTFSIDFDLRDFALDDVYFNDGQLLTGIQLFPENNLIRTKIYGAKAVKQDNSIDLLQPQSPYGYSLSNMNLNELNVQGKKVGLNSWDNNFTVTRSDDSNTYVKFGTSDENTDAGQTTVPFFDTTEIIQDFPLALSGIGYIHYSNNEYAGYLRPILKSVDLKYFMQ